MVTRNQQTGEKKIYVNGVLDASDFGSTDFLSDATELDIGFNNGQTFTGELDDIQFYSGVLSSNEVLQLYDNPGTTIPESREAGERRFARIMILTKARHWPRTFPAMAITLFMPSNFGGSGPSISPDDSRRCRVGFF